MPLIPSPSSTNTPTTTQYVLSTHITYISFLPWKDPPYTTEMAFLISHKTFLHLSYIIYPSAHPSSDLCRHLWKPSLHISEFCPYVFQWPLFLHLKEVYYKSHRALPTNIGKYYLHTIKITQSTSHRSLISMSFLSPILTSQIFH